MEQEPLSLSRRLRQEILFARERVYRFGQPTPLERLILPPSDKAPSPEIWVKREDLSCVKCYKWRGAGNRMAILANQPGLRGVVTASAGNHAQGVALAAQMLKIPARIFMPRSTPKVKSEAVKRIGGEFVEIVMAGDSYDDAVASAYAEVKDDFVYVHAYDDLQVMAGQGTMADEIVLSGRGPFDAAFLQIGGGGMASAVGTWLKTYWPHIEMIGVEEAGQASMTAAMEKDQLVRLKEVDIFCDGTAIRQAGKLPFEICRKIMDGMVTVTKGEVTAAIRILWESLRCISEPSGAIGLAGVLKNREALAGKRVLVVVTGANMDFLQLGLLAQSAGASSNYSQTLRIGIQEQAHAMLTLLDTCFNGLNISDFQYGKNHTEKAWPIFTVTAENATDLAELPKRLNAAGYIWEDLSGAEDVAFRAIPWRADLLKNPVFYRLDFYERPGALHDFLNRHVRNRADLCYFNYRQSGERVGRALIGFDFPTPETRDHFIATLPEHGDGYRTCKKVDDSTFHRLAS